VLVALPCQRPQCLRALAGGRPPRPASWGCAAAHAATAGAKRAAAYQGAHSVLHPTRGCRVGRHKNRCTGRLRGWRGTPNGGNPPVLHPPAGRYAPTGPKSRLAAVILGPR
jgi:hypothetical protein